MSNSQLDDLNQDKADMALANALGITVDELKNLDHGDVESVDSNDDLTYRQYIEIQKNPSSVKILEKVIKNVYNVDNGDYITAYIEFKESPDENEDSEQKGMNRINHEYNDDDLI